MSEFRSTPPSRVAEQGGQTLVEFALVLPIFLLAVFGLLDVGRLVYTNSALSQAAREGARLGAAEAAWIGASKTAEPACVSHSSEIGTANNPGAHVCPTSVVEFKAHIVEAVNRMAVSLGPITAVHVSCNFGDDIDPVPSGDWTEADGGNGCRDGLFSSGLVSVRVEYVYQPMTPVITSLISTVPLSGSATMSIH